MSRGVLLVTSGGRRMGLPLQGILEVGDVPAVERVPGSAPAVRGVMRARGRLVPLAHLGALVSGKACPAPTAERSAVLATVADRWLALEVEQVDAAPDEVVLPPPEGSALAELTVGVVRRDQHWIPILNLEALAERLQGEGGGR
ncbi:MAG TPA: chemotaxis protein CheW [Gemmatimonadales bacterium]|nr:chemotaxis protein CheW [Gemmatimonadales bacterium]